MYKSLKFIFLLAILSIVSCKDTSEEKESVTLENTQKKELEKKETPADEVEYAEGKAVYTQYCMTCHQANGSGVPNLNPPLRKTDYVLGDKKALIAIILNGSTEGLEINGKTYSNNMPPFNYLKDEEIAAVLSYVRNNFGNEAEAISPAEVKAVREKE